MGTTATTIRNAAMALAALAMVFSGTAIAKPTAPIGKTSIKLDKSMKKLPFGKDVKATLKWVGAKMKAKRVKLSVIKAELKRLKTTIVHFTPRADMAAWNVSVIADEYKLGNAESMLQWNDGKHTHYFFFHRAKLYKYARPVLVPRRTLGFVDRVNTLSRLLGEPTGTISPGGNDTVVEARWVASKIETRIVDRRAKHRADVLIVEHFKLWQKVLDARNGRGADVKTYAADPDLQEFLE